MSQVDTYYTTLLLCERSNLPDVEELAGEEVYSREKDERDLVAMLLDKSFDLLLPDGELTFARTSQEQALVRFKTVMNHLRLDGVVIGRKSRIFHEDLAASLSRTIEGRHHEMKIDREAIHADNLARSRADQPARAIAHCLVVGIPWSSSFQMRIDRKLRPVIQLLLDYLSGR